MRENTIFFLKSVWENDMDLARSSLINNGDIGLLVCFDAKPERFTGSICAVAVIDPGFDAQIRGGNFKLIQRLLFGRDNIEY